MWLQVTAEVVDGHLGGVGGRGGAMYGNDRGGGCMVERGVRGGSGVIVIPDQVHTGKPPQVAGAGVGSRYKPAAAATEVSTSAEDCKTLTTTPPPFWVSILSILLL